MILEFNIKRKTVHKELNTIRVIKEYMIQKKEINASTKNISDVPDYFGFTKDKIAGNKREKIDLLFNDNYGVSVKTLMQNNKEINLGSFDKSFKELS